MFRCSAMTKIVCRENKLIEVETWHTVNDRFGLQIGIIIQRNCLNTQNTQSKGRWTRKQISYDCNNKQNLQMVAIA